MAARHKLAPTAAAFLVGCLKLLPAGEPAAARDYYVRAPFDSVWQGTIAVFTDHRLPIKVIDKASGLLVTEKVLFSGERAESWADCGRTRSGEPALPAMRRLNIAFSVEGDFNVFVRPAGDSTAVRVNLGVEGNHGPGNIRLRCVSTGVFERQLVEQIGSARP